MESRDNLIANVIRADAKKTIPSQRAKSSIQLHFTGKLPVWIASSDAAL